MDTKKVHLWPALVFLLITANLNISRVCSYEITEQFGWNMLDWAYPDDSVREFAIRTGQFSPQNSLPVGIEIWRNKLFVITPRWKKGVPATLNYIPLHSSTSHSPKLIPYPSWEQNVAGDCGDSLTSTYRVHADQCNRLWVLDSGTMPLGNKTINACPFTIKVFDLLTNTIIRRYELPPSNVKENTFVANIAVDLGPGGCNDAFAYMSDELGYGLIVYDWWANKSWRVTHSFFHPNPFATDFNVAGINYQRPDEGIFGLALSPIGNDGYRTLLFHPFSSNTEFAVSTKFLRDEHLSQNSFHAFKVLGNRYRGHSTSEVMDDNGILWFNLIEHNATACWNSGKPYEPQNHHYVARNNRALIFPSDVKIYNGLVWIISDRMAIFTERQLDYSDVNFRILTIPRQEAIAGTVCDLR